MAPWTGIALARTVPGGDGMCSRLSTYLHPLAGRPLLWHTLSCLATIRPAADRLILVSGGPLPAELWTEFGAELELMPAADGTARPPELGEDDVLVVDGAAPALGPHLNAMAAAPAGTLLPAPDGGIAAARLGAADAATLLAGGSGLDAARELPAVRLLEPVAQAIIVRDRRALAAAGRMVHDVIIGRLMDAGVTFLLPDSVLVDVDVQVGRDTVIYPGAVLEGQTSVGEETVVGPGCRIVDSWIGSGVELKGWNFISGASVRNRAIVEPYVRRGFD